MHNSTELQLISYLSNATNGVFRCPEHIAKGILAIVQGTPKPYVVLRRLNNNDLYEPVHTESLTEEKLAEVVAKMHKDTQLYGFYQFDCHSADGRLLRTFYSANPNLFD